MKWELIPKDPKHETALIRTVGPEGQVWVEHCEWIEQDLEIPEGWRSLITGDYLFHSCEIEPIHYMAVPGLEDEGFETEDCGCVSTDCKHVG